MNIDAFIDILAQQNWDDIINNEIDTAVNILTDFINNAALECIPKRKLRVKHIDKPWVTGTLKNEIKRRNKFFQSSKGNKY